MKYQRAKPTDHAFKNEYNIFSYIPEINKFTVHKIKKLNTNDH